MLHPLRVVAAVGAITRLFSMAFLVPVITALFYDPYDMQVLGAAVPRTVLIFFFCFALTYLIGAGLRWAASSVEHEDLADREAYLTVGLGWLLLCGLSAVPFTLTGVLTNPVDALFEAMSGLTTTGATVINGELEAVIPSLMMWRSFLQFLGGMGIIVLSVAILAKLTQGGMQMLQAEVPGGSVGRMAPRLAQTARLMWGVYLALAASLFVVLFALLSIRHEMDLKTVTYEALLHTFSGISTGGFSNHTTSIAFFADPLIEIVFIVFMLISGMNFTLIILVRQGHWKTMFKDGEWRLYIGNYVVVTLLLTGLLMRAGAGALQALRDSSFVSAAMMTSTGYATADYDLWPTTAKMLILFVMVAGGMGGSTSGGLKLVRILLLWKLVHREILRLQHPHAVLPIRIAGRTVKPQTIMATVGFFFAFIAFWIIGTIVLETIDPAFTSIEDAASASLSAISNMGPGLGVVGPTKNFASLTDASKIILTSLMWFGRLEIFTAMLLFAPNTWRH
jgi:trk system potassium uptake protein TrkH